MEALVGYMGHAYPAACVRVVVRGRPSQFGCWICQIPGEFRRWAWTLAHTTKRFAHNSMHVWANMHVWTYMHWHTSHNTHTHKIMKCEVLIVCLMMYALCQELARHTSWRCAYANWNATAYAAPTLLICDLALAAFCYVCALCYAFAIFVVVDMF